VENKLRILFIALPNSIHTARWISQINTLGWDIHLFPSESYPIHSDLKNLTVHDVFFIKQKNKVISVKFKGIILKSPKILRVLRGILLKFSPNFRDKKLVKLIKNLKPDIVHSLGIQHGGYPVLEAKKDLGLDFPPWIVSSWGSDLYLFGRLNEHKQKVKEILSLCDYFTCDCRRDITLSMNYGFSGTAFSPLPGGGGFDLNACQKMIKSKPSKRRKILLKGYQGWSGRALVGLHALRRCGNLLRGFEIIIFSASSDVRIAAELFSSETGIHVSILPDGTQHSEILRQHCESRIYLGLGISDGLPNSMLESIVMGSFPIQSSTSCCDEWITDGENGFIVPPEDVDIVENALRKVLIDDKLVDKAAEINYEVAKERLNYNFLRKQAIEMYKKISKRLNSNNMNHNL
jgi:hypothetical protein|tara:strand:+ start:918 stop:2132 length:1215 start_codon:yes stop_codon:yes gene_type:complete